MRGCMNVCVLVLVVSYDIDSDARNGMSPKY